MLEVMRAEKCKELDNRTINAVKIPGIILMENAAEQLFNKIKLMGDSFLIICGKGNNGGDGLALARKLFIAGKNVKIIIISKDNNFTNDFQSNFVILKNIIDKNKIVFIRENDDINNIINDINYNYDYIIDAIFGVGLNRDITGVYRVVIDEINNSSKKVISIDIPSGIDSDSGNVMGNAVKADITYTIETLKRCFFNYNVFEYMGKVKVLSIGIPNDIKRIVSDRVFLLDRNEYKEILKERSIYSHKGDFGRAVIVAGSKGFTGAAFIATECTIRTGAGLVTLVCNPDIQNIMSEKLIEAMTISTQDNNMDSIIRKADSIAIGPGIGINKVTEDLIETIIKNSTCPLVIDADAIRILSVRKDLFKYIEGRAVLTPHPGEMSQLIGKTIKEIEQNRISIATEAAAKYKVIILLKGYNTVISDGNCTYINTTGNSKMASGGMGDALTGIINGFSSQKLDLMKSALLGAYIHGEIADNLGKDNYIINARDIINNLPKFINKIIK